MPKFEGKLLGRWLQPRLRHPFLRIKLDDYGTAVWECCDGSTTVYEISQQLQNRFGDAVAPLIDRLGLFVRQLENQRLIRFNNLRHF